MPTSIDITDDLPLDYGHTCMNRFAMLDLRGLEPPTQAQLAHLATNLCSSLFADDMLVLDTSASADVRLRIIGGDGRDADVCANGLIYTAAKLGAELGREQVSVDMPSGVRQARRRGTEWDAEVGEVFALDAELDAAGQSLPRGTTVPRLLRAGEPHVVLSTPTEVGSFNIDRSTFECYCRPLRDIMRIPGGVKVTVVIKGGKKTYSFVLMNAA